ncbi:hypothetical protein LEMLEM_LOCUS246 [Lemmus lemmus]
MYKAQTLSQQEEMLHVQLWQEMLRHQTRYMQSATGCWPLLGLPSTLVV